MSRTRPIEARLIIAGENILTVTGELYESSLDPSFSLTNIGNRGVVTKDSLTLRSRLAELETCPVYSSLCRILHNIGSHVAGEERKYELQLNFGDYQRE